MKKMISITLCLLILLSLTACGEKSDPCDLRSGNYYMKGNEEINETPYVRLDFDKYTFWHCESPLSTQAEHGSFVVKDDMIIATTDQAVYEFRIVGEKIIVLLKVQGQRPLYMLEHSVFMYES